MSKNITSEVVELTIDEFTQMLTEYAEHDHGPLRGEAQRLLKAMDTTHPANLRYLVNDWTITYQAHHGQAPSKLASTIILQAPISDRLAAARVALADAMPSLVASYNQLYRMMVQTNHPAMDQLIMFAEALEQDYPGICFFLDAKSQRLEDVGSQQEQLDVVIDFLLRQPASEHQTTFRLTTPQVRQITKVEDEGIKVKFGDTQVIVRTQSLPIADPVSAISAYQESARVLHPSGWR